MRRTHTTMEEPRMDLLPLLDVVFLLITFFLFAMALMVRADVLGLSLPTVTTGQRAPDSASITISIDAEGTIKVDGDSVQIETLLAHLEAIVQAADARGESPIVFVAADQGGRSGDLLAVLDTLATGGIEHVSILGTPGETPPGQND